MTILKSLSIQLVFIIILIASSSAKAQEENNLGEKVTIDHHQIGVLLGHTHMKEGKVDTENNWLSVPSFTMFYNYLFSKKMFLGLHTDFITEQFVVQSEGEETIGRESPIAPAVMIGFKPSEHFTILAGGGVDIDNEDTLGLIRIDIEYGLEIRNGLEFLATLGYDIRLSAFNSFQIGVGLGQSF